MPNSSISPEPTAVRVALWRALHAQIDAPPLVFADEIGAQIVAEANWQKRQDMNPDFSRAMRASIVARARFIEDLVEEETKGGVLQYVILGSGLDTFAQRRTAFAPGLKIYEVDQPGPQAWKQKRIAELGLTSHPGLRFVPVDFEAGQSWWKQIQAAGFDHKKPAVVASTGVSMYLSRAANFTTLRQVAQLASGSTLAMSFLLSLDHLVATERDLMEFVMKKAKESGTPFLSLFSPEEITAAAKTAGFKRAKYISAADLHGKYLAARPDGLHAGNAEGFLLAST